MMRNAPHVTSTRPQRGAACRTIEPLTEKFVCERVRLEPVFAVRGSEAPSSIGAPTRNGVAVGDGRQNTAEGMTCLRAVRA
jgi:hypothetical protein